MLLAAQIHQTSSPLLLPVHSLPRLRVHVAGSDSLQLIRFVSLHADPAAVVRGVAAFAEIQLRDPHIGKRQSTVYTLSFLSSSAYLVKGRQWRMTGG